MLTKNQSKLEMTPSLDFKKEQELIFEKSNHEGESISTEPECQIESKVYSGKYF